MRRVPQLLLMGLALATAAACSDSTSRLMAPIDGPNATKVSEQAGGSVSRMYTSSSGVTATTYSGNTSGDGGSSCLALGFGRNGTKVDGASSSTLAGYRFTVSANGQSLSFAPVSGATPTSAILVVVVKGGPAYNVYNYSGTVRISDGGLISPLNGGGNVPTISHYVVCFGLMPNTPATISKKLVGVMKEGPTIGSMEPDPNWQPGQTVVSIPYGKTRWLDYEVTYTLPSGVTGTITEDSHAVCGTLQTFILQCSFNLAPTPTGVYAWSGLSGAGSITVPIDLGGGGGGSCGDHVFTNTAKLIPSVGGAVSASTDITVRVVCPAP
jgi:hypothetical protein